MESLIEHRASIEGPGTTAPEGLLRVSVGLEHPDDLIDDLAQANALTGSLYEFESTLLTSATTSSHFGDAQQISCAEKRGARQPQP